MKKIITLFLAISCFSSFQIQALLPPFYQSLKEYKALLDDPQLSELFTSADIIQDIKRDDKGFTVTSNKNKLRVDVISQPAKRIGPEEFTLRFYKLEPL